MWMLHGCSEHKLEFDDVRDFLREDLMWAHLWGHQTREQKQAELAIKDTDRCIIAPYHVRIVLLSRLIAHTATEMKQNPGRRLLRTDKDIGSKPKVNFVMWPSGKDNITEEMVDEAILHPSRVAKRARTMPSLKDGLLTVDIPGKKKKNLMLTSVCSISKLPETDDDIVYSNLELKSVWLIINQNAAGSWLAWTYKNSEFAIYNDDRFRRMIKTQRDMAHEDQDNENEPVYELALRNGM